MREFEWDETKRRVNLIKHGIDFRDARDIFDGRMILTKESPRITEERFATTSELHGMMVTAIWTQRGDAIRIISVRRARHAEEREYRDIHGR